MPQGPPQRRAFEEFEKGGRRETLRDHLSKPVTIIAIVLCIAIFVFVLFLQQGPSSLTLEVPAVDYELMSNQGITAGVPIAIRLGDLMVFQISDPLAGGGGAARAKQVVDNLTLALDQLVEDPPRVITIEDTGEGGAPTIVQKEYEDSEESLEIVSVMADDLVLAETDDPKLLARLWAERLTDSLRLLIFGQPPEFSRETPFGSALDTLYVNAMNAEGALTTAALDTAYRELPANLQQALTQSPPKPPVAIGEPAGGQPSAEAGG